MKNINDSRLYLIIAATALAVGVAIGGLSYYSILFVEPKIERLLTAGDYREAYLMLRDPQIFAGYGNFDAEGFAIKNSLVYFDRCVYYGEQIDESRRVYLDNLLDRRKKGSRLGRNTMVFFLALSCVFWGVWFQERRAARP